MTEVIESNGLHYSVRESSVLKTPTPSGKKPTQLRDPDTTTSTKIAAWGDDNLYPQKVLNDISKVTLVEPILEWKARALYGGGLCYGILSIDEKGEEVYRQIFDNEIDDWMDGTDIMQYLQEASRYFYDFYNIFPELTQSLDGSKINYLTCKESTDTRWALREKEGKNKGLITKAYMSADWEQHNEDSKDYSATFDVLPLQRNPIEWAKQKKNSAFIYPISFPSSGRSYYQRAPWHVLLDTWLPIAREIPAFKKALLQNQLSIRYIIKVPEWWWKWKYSDWDRKTEQQRIKIIKEEHESFELFFSGSNSGRSIMYTQRDSTAAHQYGKWEVDVVDDKLKTGMYIEDSQEADAHIFKNLQVDPTLFGSGPGKNQQSSGSGSDKRVAWNNYIIQQQAYQDLILKPLYFIARYNGWKDRLAKPGERLVWWFRNYQIARLDSGSETKAV